ncbi:hypothetical protein BDW71DRAFT_167957 [Aspergillus fruticulosus]
MSTSWHRPKRLDYFSSYRLKHRPIYPISRLPFPFSFLLSFFFVSWSHHFCALSASSMQFQACSLYLCSGAPFYDPLIFIFVVTCFCFPWPLVAFIMRSYWEIWVPPFSLRATWPLSGLQL